jgi:hypothetical protein
MRITRVIDGQALPQRIGDLLRPRMVAAQRLVDHPQVEPEVVGPSAPAQHAARQRHGVTPPWRKLDGPGRNAAAQGHERGGFCSPPRDVANAQGDQWRLPERLIDHAMIGLSRILPHP